MRTAAWLTGAMAVALVALPMRAPAQVNISIAFGTRLGPEVRLFAYSRERYGDWRANYRRWTPVVVYDVNGHYYRHDVHGARAIVVYTYNGEYFLPPSDQAWVGFDARYDYHRRPVDVDEHRVVAYEPVVRADPRLGEEIDLWAYSPDRAGPWQRNYRRWTPVIVYERHGRYYPHRIPGMRAVEVYRYGDEYFLPPTDAGWIGADHRFDYKLRPTDDDRGRGHRHP